MTDELKAYRIVDWDQNFEKAQSNKVKIASWVPVPIKHDGKTFRRITQHPDAVSIYCGWQLIVQVAAKMPIRGVLIDEDGPVTSSDLSAMTGFPLPIFDKAYEVLSSPKFRWLEQLSKSMLGDYSQQLVERCRVSNLRLVSKYSHILSSPTSSVEEGEFEGEQLGKYKAAVDAFRKSHPQCLNVPTVAIINTLRGWPEDRWMNAIETMGRHYAGAQMRKPIGHLENFLAGKPIRDNGSHEQHDTRKARLS